jgi:chromate transporter
MSLREEPGAGLFYGIKPAVAAIVLQAVWRIGSRTLKHPRRVPLLWVIALLSFLAIAVAHVPFPWVVLAAATAGAWGGKYLPAQFAADAAHGAAGSADHVRSERGFVIDDATPTPEHALFRKSRLALVLCSGACCGSCRWPRWWWRRLGRHPGADGLVFYQAAPLTFGGAYAVLPYVR